MHRRELIHVLLIIIVVPGMLLAGKDCPAQTDPCNPDPCGRISYAVEDSCHDPIPAGVCGPADFTCDCMAGFRWKNSTNTCRSDMAQIPAGCFDMGDSSDGCMTVLECPVHNVCISAFEMDVNEVTNEEYSECIEDGGCTAPSNTHSATRATYYGDPAFDNFPVIWVNWFQAMDYCTWTGKRLPTEAEWEYAARGGLAGKRYPWGDTISGSDANYYNSGDPWDNDTSAVAYYPANGYGIYDVAGNVWEWVNDWYDDAYYQYCVDNGIVNDPSGPENGTSRVVRGSAYNCVPGGLSRVANRGLFDPDNGHIAIGFRCARGGAYGP